MKQVAFEGKAFADFTDWATQDKKLYAKIISFLNFFCYTFKTLETAGWLS